MENKFWYIVHDKENIKGFVKDYRFLSNFHQAPVYFEGFMYPSTENAYMAAKTLNTAERTQFIHIEPKEAKALGRKIALRPDWETVKVDIMASVVFDKFYRHKSLRKKLLATGNAYLSEANHWKDLVWGTDEEGNGQNLLGKLLMNIRAFWQNQQNEKSSYMGNIS